MQINTQQQQILSNTFLVEKAQQATQDKPAVYHALSSDELKKKEAEKQRQVPDSNKSDEVMIREKERGKEQEKRESKNKKKKAGQSQTAEESDHILDVMV